MAKPFLALWLLAFCLPVAAATPARVVTLAPNLTELAYSAGITPVGVSAWSDYPPDAKNVPQVANWQGIDTEQILALKPDVVLAWRDGNPLREVERLKAFGVQVVWIEPASVADMAATLRQLKRWSPHPERAEQAATALENAEKTLATRYSALPKKAVFLQFGLRPLFTTSGKTLQNQILQLCAGRNIFEDSPVPWPQVSREQVLMRQPEVIVSGGDAAQVAQINAYWQPQLNVPVIMIDDDAFSRAGPRIVLAAKQLCEALHPEITR